MFSRVRDIGKWQVLLERTRFKTFFHSLEWESCLEKNLSWIKFSRYIWRDECLISIARCNLFGKKKIASHPFCEYGGPLPLKDNIDASNFERDFTRAFGAAARMRSHPYIRTYMRSYIRSNENVGQGLASFLIEDFSKKNTSDLWQGFRKTLRHEIKKAAGTSITVSECANEEELTQFYNIYAETIKRHKNIPLPFSIIRFFYIKSDPNIRMTSEFTNDIAGRMQEPFSKIFLAKKDNKIIGGSVFLFYAPFIHYFINASEYGLRNMSIAHAILWHVMQAYVGDSISHIGKYEYFDLGGTRKGSSLEVFKRGWGTVEYPIYEIGSRSGEEVSGWKRSLWGTLPTSAIRAIAPYALFFKV